MVRLRGADIGHARRGVGGGRRHFGLGLAHGGGTSNMTFRLLILHSVSSKKSAAYYYMIVPNEVPPPPALRGACGAVDRAALFAQYSIRRRGGTNCLYYTVCTLYMRVDCRPCGCVIDHL